MSTALTTITDKGVSVGLFAIADEGLIIPEVFTFEEWAMAGAQFLKLNNRCPWALGDWLNCGEDEFGEKYSQGLEMTEYSYNTLKSYAWVCRQVGPEQRRIDELDFSHHRLVAKMDEAEQDFWLQKAIDNTWSVKTMEQEIKATMGDGDGGGGGEPPIMDYKKGMENMADKLKKFKALAIANTKQYEEALVLINDLKECCRSFGIKV